MELKVSINHVGYSTWGADITVSDLKAICLKTADIIAGENWSHENVAEGQNGEPVCLYSNEAVRRDGLGWLLKVANDHFKEPLVGKRIKRKHLRSIEFIDSHIRTVTNNTERLISLALRGPREMSLGLRYVAKTLGDELPTVFNYMEL